MDHFHPVDLHTKQSKQVYCSTWRKLNKAKDDFMLNYEDENLHFDRSVEQYSYLD